MTENKGLLTDEETRQKIKALHKAREGDYILLERCYDASLPQWNSFIAQLSAELTRKDDEEKYREAILLAVDVAGLKQDIFSSEDILGLAERAEEILEALKRGS